MAEPGSTGRVCGVRLTRNGRIRFLECHGLDLRPGQCVVVDLAGQEQIATVVFGANQLVSSEVDVVTEGGISPYMEDRILGEAVAL